MEKFNSDPSRTRGPKLSGCAFPNRPNQPIRSPVSRQHHLHYRRGRRSGAFGGIVGRSRKALQNRRTYSRRGIMVGLKAALCLTALTLPLALGGCAGALLVGALAGVAGGGYAAAQERGVGGAVSDLEIETNVESVFAATDPGLKDGITTNV